MVEILGRGRRAAVLTAAVTASVCAVVWCVTTVLAPQAGAGERKPATELLASLPVGPEHVGGYAREMFRHWIDADGDRCDTRREVLLSEAVAGQAVGCTVVGGAWVSFYDGVRTADASTFDIDHMVPLKEAWDSGAFRWSPQTRQAFANDLGYPPALVAVTASSNRSKSDQDPATWQPAAGRCRYAKSWIGVKYRWRLGIDVAEKAALQRMLAGCPLLMVVPELAPTP